MSRLSLLFKVGCVFLENERSTSYLLGRSLSFSQVQILLIQVTHSTGGKTLTWNLFVFVQFVYKKSEHIFSSHSHLFDSHQDNRVTVITLQNNPTNLWFIKWNLIIDWSWNWKHTIWNKLNLDNSDYISDLLNKNSEIN